MHQSKSTRKIKNHQQNGESQVAAKLIEKQKNMQLKRRVKLNGRGTGFKRSIWISHAAITFMKKDKPKYICRICDSEGSLNKKLSSSNIIDHYKNLHPSTYSELIKLQSSNAQNHVLNNFFQSLSS